MVQGLSGSIFYWDDKKHCFCVQSGIYVSHLSQMSLYRVLNQFMFAANCLKVVDIVVNKIQKSKSLPPPTLRAFACSVSAWLRVSEIDITYQLFWALLLYSSFESFCLFCHVIQISYFGTEDTRCCSERRGEGK